MLFLFLRLWSKKKHNQTHPWASSGGHRGWCKSFHWLWTNHVLAHTQDAWGKVCIRAGESAPGKGFRCSKISGLAETHGSALKKSFYYLRVSIRLVEDCFQGVNGEGWAPSDTRTSLSTLSLAKYEHDLKEGTYLTIWKKEVTGTNSGLSWVGLERL